MQLRAVIFDVDGTLVDSQADIMGAMQVAFAGQGIACPERSEILARVGLSLDAFFADLLPHVGLAQRAELIAGYKAAFRTQRLERRESAPLYPGVRKALQELRERDEVLMGLATGKSRRGLEALVDAHDLSGFFQTQHCADDHPSKPHPAMLEAAMADLGVTPEQTVMVGDTRFDLEMAAAAGAAFVGVPWGYHRPEQLQGAETVLDSFAELESVLDGIWSRAHV